MKDNNKTSVAAIVGLVLSIIALLISAVPIINNFAFVFGAIGLVCGVLALVAVNKGKRDGKKIAIATIVLSAVALVIVIASQAMYGKVIDDVSKKIDDTASRANGEKTDEILGKEVDVQLGQFSAVSDEYGFVKTELPVKVTNKLAEKKSYYIQVEVVDASGTRLADDYINTNDLGANQAQDFKAFQYVDSAKLDAIKAGSFKVVKVSQL